jgi:hypothetical protein
MVPTLRNALLATVIAVAARGQHDDKIQRALAGAQAAQAAIGVNDEDHICHNAVPHVCCSTWLRSVSLLGQRLHQFVGLGRPPSCRQVPPRCCEIARHTDKRKGIAAKGDVVEIFGTVAASAQGIKLGIQKTQRPVPHTDWRCYDAGPLRRALARTEKNSPTVLIGVRRETEVGPNRSEQISVVADITTNVHLT